MLDQLQPDLVHIGHLNHLSTSLVFEVHRRSIPLEAGAVEDIALGAVCPFLGQEAWVSAQERFNPCCAPDALRLTLGEFGNLGERSLYDIWQSPVYQSLQATYQTHPLCKGCNMRRPERS